jgi:hypothetical protein
MTKTLSTFVAVTALVWASSSCSSETSEPAKPAPDAAADDDKAEVKANDSTKADDTENEAAKPDEADTAKPADDAAPEADKPAAQDDKPADGAPTTEANADPAALDHTTDIRGHCKLDSGYADDKACIPAPKAGEGIQIHIGPSNYDDPEEVAKFIMKPGEESSQCFTLNTPNKEAVTYQTFMLSGRAGTHHMINTLYEGELPTGSFGPCDGRSVEGVTPAGSLPGASKAYMSRSKVAPEYEHVGQVLNAEATLQADMHYFNFTDKDILREVWLNLYFAPDPSKVTEYSKVIRGFGGLGWNQEPIQPGTDMVYKYQCAIKGDGNIMSLLGHYHAHGKQFTASILRKESGETEKVFEMFDYLEPATFDYNTVTTNPMFQPNAAGALSGILSVKDGDTLLWDCHIINDSMVALRYVNEVKTGEMCNVWGYSIGTEPIVCDLR